MPQALSTDRTRLWQRALWRSAGMGAVLCLLLALLDVRQFLRGYLLGFLFLWVVVMGCLGLVMLHHLVGGRWGQGVRPFLHAGAATLPLVAVLFLVIAIGVPRIFPWAQEGALAEYPKLQEKIWYLNSPFFLARAAGYFLIWLGGAGLLGDLRYLPSAPRRGRRRSPLLSAVALALLVVTVTFAAIDWIMSLEPEWYSTMFGALTAMGGALAALALASGAAALAARRWSRRPAALAADLLGDAGSMLLALLMLWAYFAFSQYLIVWSGNLPEENIWFVRRLAGPAGYLALVIVLLHFVAPFALLLSRDVKQSATALASVAGLILVAHFLYLFWTVVPAFGGGIVPHLGDLLVPLTLGCAWLAAFLWCLPPQVWQETSVQEDSVDEAEGEAELLTAPRRFDA
jgi:hypothetical protein